MRLINATTFELEQVDNLHECPDYAILSHRWVHGDEVTFQDFQGKHRRWMPGWSKIQFCCEQAIKDGWTHVWVDTCCIAKDSSAELSEAINSMYDWYARAKVCYAYLNDIEDDKAKPVWTNIMKSSWFTRAWTLQELLAPLHVIFFDSKFSRLASKQDISQNIQDAIQIPADVLCSPDRILSYPVAVRMSWAAKRQALRVEDLAYSLFGLFQVNLPLLYGEGKRSFIRLQEEIIKNSHDHSIFTWMPHASDCISLGMSHALPLLAPSLNRFEGHSQLTTREEEDEVRAYTMTNIGLRIDLPVTPYTLNVYAALLDCGPHSLADTSVAPRYAILLARDNPNTKRFYRASVDGRSLIEIGPGITFRWQEMHIVRSPDLEYLRKTSPTPLNREVSKRQFYGVHIQAPTLFRHKDLVRPYALVAYHDWREDRRPSFGEATAALAKTKFNSSSVELLGPLSNVDMAIPVRESTHRLGMSKAINRASAHDEAGAMLHHQSQQQTMLSGKLASLSVQPLSGPQLGVNAEPPRLVDSHDDISIKIEARRPAPLEPITDHQEALHKPIGTMEMPVLSTGTAGIVHFDQPIHGLRSIKAGIDFSFCPVVFVATYEADSDLEIQRWIQQTRFVGLRTFEQSHYLLDDFHEEGARQFWKLHPDMIAARQRDLEVSNEGVIRLNKGIYAFKPKDLNKREHWIFKPDESQNWHLALELYRSDEHAGGGWTLEIGLHEEQLQITVEVM